MKQDYRTKIGFLNMLCEVRLEWSTMELIWQVQDKTLHATTPNKFIIIKN